jgi:hypothetical protein
MSCTVTILAGSLGSFISSWDAPLGRSRFFRVGALDPGSGRFTPVTRPQFLDGDPNHFEHWYPSPVYAARE